MTPNLLYEATVTSNLPRYGSKLYKGISEPPWKDRYGNHKKSFNNQKYKNETCLSKEVWRVKSLGGTTRITWRPIKQHRGYNPTTGKCALCTSEKLEILEHRGPNLLNKRAEIVATCRHRLKYMLTSNIWRHSIGGTNALYVLNDVFLTIYLISLRIVVEVLYETVSNLMKFLSSFWSECIPLHQFDVEHSQHYTVSNRADVHTYIYTYSTRLKNEIWHFL